MHASHRLKRLLTFIGIRFCVASLLWSGVAYSSDVPGNFSVCFDFSCKTSQLVQLSRQDWYQVEGLFYLNANAKEERIRLREAVAIMEQIVGTYTPTFQDVALNWPSDSADDSTNLVSTSGQMDCIDESINTTNYLKILEHAGLLKFHRVMGRAYRRSLFNQHWAAQISETATQQRYVIDSWFKKNGELPIMVKGEVWQDLSLF